MKKILALLQHIANLNNFSFVFGVDDDANIDADSVAYPSLFVSVPRFTLDANKSNVFGSCEIEYSVVVEIRFKSELPYSEAERIDNYEQATEIFKSIVFNLVHLQKDDLETTSKYVRRIRAGSGRYDKNKYDANTDGLVCEFSLLLNEAQGQSCPLPVDLES